MRPRWVFLSDREKKVYEVARLLLAGRLQEQATIDWALQTEKMDALKRNALLDILEDKECSNLSEPYRTVWHLIDESWNNPKIEDRTETLVVHIQKRIQDREISYSLVKLISDIVKPILHIKSISLESHYFRELPKKPAHFKDLIKTELTSGRIVDPRTMGISEIDDGPFLLDLAKSVNGTVEYGISLARRIWGSEEIDLWPISDVRRVYYVPGTDREQGEGEPDAHNYGIAPSVKLLHAVVYRMVELSMSEVEEFLCIWKLRNTALHLRLWASISSLSRIPHPNIVGDFLLSLDEERFWNRHKYPEFALLRARRFGELKASQQKMLCSRIKQGPPQRWWNKISEADEIIRIKIFWAVQEFLRIQMVNKLPQDYSDWVENMLSLHPDIEQITSLENGFMSGTKVLAIPSIIDNQYDDLSGEERLKALEASLSKDRTGINVSPKDGALLWLQNKKNIIDVLHDLIAITDAGVHYPKVWERFFYGHSPDSADSNILKRDINSECEKVLSLLGKFPDSIISKLIRGVSYWLNQWALQVFTSKKSLQVFLILWPIAVEDTDQMQNSGDELDLDTIARSSNADEPEDLDVYNSSVGHLVQAFLKSLPNLTVVSLPFYSGTKYRKIRRRICESEGRSGLIARILFISSVGYMLKSDQKWTSEYIVKPLMIDNDETSFYWRAVSRSSQNRDLIPVIGTEFVRRTMDKKLSRKTRSRLFCSLVLESIDAFREKRKASITIASIQQAIRMQEDEIRVDGVRAVGRYIRNWSKPVDGNSQRDISAKIFNTSVKPFFQEVWPQERSLVTPALSKEFAAIPATTKAAFADAVKVVERFLLPFECWSMLDYRLYGEEDDKPVLSMIDDSKKAGALLSLLDLTIGDSEGSVIPYDLDDALEQINRVDKSLSAKVEFQRLATLAHRG